MRYFNDNINGKTIPYNINTNDMVDLDGKKKLAISAIMAVMNIKFITFTFFDNQTMK